MAPSSFTPLGDVLRYLSEIGYGELYRPGSQRAAASSPTTSQPSESGPLAELAKTASTCTRCRLAEGRKSVVFGSGDPAASLMLVGEGPGAEEDRQGLPFVGPAGELLTRILRAIELSREQVYIANIVKCRPPGNRDPLPDEVEACKGFIDGQIAAVGPRVIVALGRVAAHVLLQTDHAVARLRGQWHRYGDADLRVTYHPAAILRNEALKRPTWEDMQQVRDRLRGES